jgi:tetratricopeptide (TPR) repeat protein
MEDRQLAALFSQAETCRRAHNWHAAIELLRRVLASDPDHANAHASLALCLLGARRPHAAAVEAGLALGSQPESPFCHYAAAAVCRAQRKLDEAYKHCLVAIDGGDGLDARVLAASIKALQNDRAGARALLLEALAISAEHTGALTQLARIELHEGKLDEARRRIELVLTLDPSDAEAHVVAGYVALARGEVSEANDHVRFVLAHDAASQSALELLTAIKARKNPLLGAWWRWNVFIGLRTDTSQLGILLGSFIVVRLVVILLGELGHEGAESLVTQIWLAFCAYTWFAPAIFRWLLERELKTVKLRDDY